MATDIMGTGKRIRKRAVIHLFWEKNKNIWELPTETGPPKCYLPNYSGHCHFSEYFSQILKVVHTNQCLGGYVRTYYYYGWVSNQLQWLWVWRGPQIWDVSKKISCRSGTCGARWACSHTIKLAAEPSSDRFPATVLTQYNMSQALCS